MPVASYLTREAESDLNEHIREHNAGFAAVPGRGEGDAEQEKMRTFLRKWLPGIELGTVGEVPAPSPAAGLLPKG